MLGFAFPIGVLIVDPSFFNGNFILMGGVFIACMGLGVAAQHREEREKRELKVQLEAIRLDISRMARELGDGK